MGKYLSNFYKLLKEKKFKSISNFLWVYPLWHSAFFQKLLLVDIFPKFGKDMYPPFVEIEVTTFCNLRCKMCEHTYWNEKPINMSFDQFKMIVDQFPNLKWAGLTGIGGSFLNKDYIKMVRYLKETSSPTLELIDTFYHIDEKMAREIVDIGVDIYFMSICGATKETYEKIMVGSDFDRVVRNVRKLIEVKKEKSTSFPILSFHYIVSKENRHEMIPFLEMIKSFNADIYEVLFTPLLHTFNEIKDWCVDIPNEDINKIKEKAKELNFPVHYNDCSKTKKPPITHCAKWIMPFIFSTGHVIPCCIGNEANKRDFQKEHSLGNVFEQSFKDIWYGEKYTKFRNMLRKGEVPIQCANCSVYDTHKH